MSTVQTLPSKNFPTRAPDETRALRLQITLTSLTGLGLVLGVGLAWSALLPSELTRWLTAASFLTAYLAGGLPAAWVSLRSLRKGKLGIDLLMILAALAAAAVGEVRDGVILLFLFSLSNTLEAYALGRTKRAVEGLMQLRPETANRRLPGDALGETRTERVPIEDLDIGDVVIVKPGERLPVDGVILRGSSAIDQAAITGESTPIDKGEGDQVFAATMNGYGALEVKVSKRSSDTTLARMIALVTEAQAARSPSQRFSDWFGERYTVVVLLGSALALALFILLGTPHSEAFYLAATLLVVASPCAVVISVPAAVLSALAAAGRGGVLFKGGAALEDFGRATLLALDKTGTLTEGNPTVTDVWSVNGDDDALLRLTASLEARSEHPIAQRIVAEADARGLRVEANRDVQAVPGLGVTANLGNHTYWAGNRTLATRHSARLEGQAANELRRLEAQGKTPVLVGQDAQLLGIVGVADTLRVSAARALEGLRANGIQQIVILTGDHAGAAQQIGLPADAIHAELLPEDKVNRVKALREKARVAFVGDGVNDAAALASADVGVAMGAAGSDVALEAADVALLSNDLTRLIDAYRLARKANRVIKQNLVFALSVMVILVLFTLFGNLPLPLGVIGHEGSTVVVVFNGLRLLLTRPQAERNPPSTAITAPCT